MWVVDYLDDLESDFSVFHRVDDLHALDGPRFFRLALRIFAYDGVLAARLADEMDPQGPSGAPVAASALGRNGARADERVDVEDLARVAPGLIDRTEV